MLAAIPSVVYGLWGIFVVIPLVHAFGEWAVVAFKNLPVLNTLFAPPAYGNSMLTASLVLALMILPTITAISRSALVAVPGTLREGAYALGSTRWEAIFGVILPTAAPGIVAATILALSFVFVNFIMQQIPYFREFQHWFLTYHLNLWQNLFAEQIPWWKIGQSLSILFGANLTFLVIGCAAFQVRDIKS
jgi:ABC-type phosphate transport system permease subunit